MVALNFPDSPTDGQEYGGYVYDATVGAWNRLPTLPALDLVEFSAVAPSNPQDGQFWFDTNAGKMYIYYNDGSSAQWVSTLGGLVGQTGTEGQMLIHNGTEWVATDGVSHNAIINGDFGISQRGTSFANPGNGDYTLDRWNVGVAGGSPTDITVSQESFTPADIEAIGYGAGGSFIRVDLTDVGTMTVFQLRQYIEDVRTFAGQAVTLSFWAKASGAIDITPLLQQNFGSGGSSTVTENLGTQTLTTGWVRYSFTVDLDSLSGKTIGSGSYVGVRFDLVEANGNVYDIWGVQLEAGPVATPFKLAGGGSKAAELALCQRYYYRIEGQNAQIYTGYCGSNTSFRGTIQLPVSPRIPPSFSAAGGDAPRVIANGFNSYLVTDLIQQRAIDNICEMRATVSSGLIPGEGGYLVFANTSDSIFEWDAEL